MIHQNVFSLPDTYQTLHSCVLVFMALCYYFFTVFSSNFPWPKSLNTNSKEGSHYNKAAQDRRTGTSKASKDPKLQDVNPTNPLSKNSSDAWVSMSLLLKPLKGQHDFKMTTGSLHLFSVSYLTTIQFASPVHLQIAIASECIFAWWKQPGWAPRKGMEHYRSHWLEAFLIGKIKCHAKN